MSKQRGLLQAVLESKIFWAVVSLLISLLLWMYVTGTEGVEIELPLDNVRVVLLGEDGLREADLVITEQSCTSVDLVLSGLRRDIGKLSSSDVTVQVDLRDVRTDGNFTKLFEIQYPSSVKKDDVTLLSSSEDSVTLTVERLVTKTVEVKGDFTGTAAAGYMVDTNLTFDPLAVKITGPKSAVDEVDSAYVLVTRENVDTTLSYMTTYTLLNRDGEEADASEITRETEEVNVTLTVLMTKTVALTVNLIPGGGATGEGDVSVQIEPRSVVLAGPSETLDAVNQIVVDTIKLGNVNTLYESAGMLITIPNDTENLSGVNTASVHLEILNLESETFTVSKDAVVCTNVPEGLEAEVMTESMQILIRTTEEDIGRIETKNIRVVADLSDVAENAGIYNVPVKISVDGYPAAGAVGEYKVYVRLSEESTS